MPDTTEKHAKYARAMEQVFSDPDILVGLDEDPEGTLDKLGFDLSPEVRKQLAARERMPVTSEAGVAAFVLPVVRVATSPAVRVVVSSTTFATERVSAGGGKAKKGGGATRK
jgi:hypothetical protein